MKTRLDTPDRLRLNVLIRAETVRNIRIYAAENNCTIAKATDVLIRDALIHYLNKNGG
jgi:hypothetical protein